MKRILNILFVLLASVHFIKAQSIIIHMENGSNHSFSLSQIDSITFTEVNETNQRFNLIQTYSVDLPTGYWSSGIAWDGSTIWSSATNSWSSYIYQHTMDASLTKTLWGSVGVYIVGLGFQDGVLWSGDNFSDRMVKYDMNTKTISNSYDPNSNDGPIGLVWDGARWWSTSHNLLQKHTNDGNLSVIKTFDLGVGVNCLTWADNYLWVVQSAGNKIMKISYNSVADDITVVTTYDVNFGHIFDITYDGTYFWITDDSVSNPTIYKAKLE